MTYPSASFPTPPDWSDIPDADLTPADVEQARRKAERTRRLHADYAQEQRVPTSRNHGHTG